MMSAESLLQSKELDDFLCSLRENISGAGNEYSYLGVNFRASRILSLKFYYTFFGLASLGANFPIPELAERFGHYRDVLSALHVNTPFMPGCGITFTIKFEEGRGASRGVYFRVKCDAKEYIEKFLGRVGLSVESHYNCFDDSGVLKYLSVDDAGKVKERNYIYCTDCTFLDAFDESSGVSFSEASCLEISTDWSDESASDNMKFIGISRVSLAHEITRRETDVIATDCERRGLMVGPWFALHGYYLHADIKSVFFFSKKQGDNSVLPLAMRAGRGRV